MLAVGLSQAQIDSKHIWPEEDLMNSHRGRLIDHIHLRVRDLEASKRFYRSVLTVIGRHDAIQEAESYFSADELWIDQAEVYCSSVHLAF